MPQRLSLIRVFLFSFLLKQEEIIIHMEHEYKFAEEYSDAGGGSYSWSMSRVGLMK